MYGAKWKKNPQNMAINICALIFVVSIRQMNGECAHICSGRDVHMRENMHMYGCAVIPAKIIISPFDSMRDKKEWQLTTYWIWPLTGGAFSIDKANRVLIEQIHWQSHTKILNVSIDCNFTRLVMVTMIYFLHGNLESLSAGAYMCFRKKIV